MKNKGSKSELNKSVTNKCAESELNSFKSSADSLFVHVAAYQLIHCYYGTHVRLLDVTCACADYNLL